MKKALFGVILALALPVMVSAQIEVITYSPTQISPYNSILHGHVDQIDDLAVGDSVSVKFYYGTDDDDLGFETEILVATRDHGEHFEIPAFGTIPGEDYFCQFSASVNGGPEMLGEVQSFDTPTEELEDPEIETSFAEHVGNNTATLVGQIDDFGSYESVGVYFQYGEDPDDLDMTTPLIYAEDPFGQFETDIKGLTAGKIINFKACATGPFGEFCGDLNYFLTPNKGNIDVEYLSMYQEDDCEMTFQFFVDMGDRPSPAQATFKIGNPGGTTYTKEFWYQGWGSEGLILDNSIFEAAGIDPFDPVIVTFVVSSFGETGKTGGTVLLQYYECDEFAGDEEEDFRISNNEMSIFPNPASEKVSIVGDQQGLLTICDITGKIVGRYNIDPGLTDIELSDLSSGTYLLHFAGEAGVFTEKVIKQ